MLYVLTQAKTMSIPINDNMIVYMEEESIFGKSYDIIAKLNNVEYFLGTYINRETALKISTNINRSRARQGNVWTEMPDIYEKVKKENG